VGWEIIPCKIIKNKRKIGKIYENLRNLVDFDDAMFSP
jgi:hypothetical protein